MNGVNGYHIYQNDMIQNMARKSYEKKAEKPEAKDVNDTKKAEKTKSSPVSLSDSAQDLLERLKKKYGNMDFIVANYSSEEEAQRYLNSGTKEYSVLIEPELLEEMAADEKTEEKYTGMIDEATTKLSDMRDQLGEDGEDVVHMGVSFGKDGSATYFAELEKSGEQQRERIEKSRSDKKEKAKKEQVKEEQKAAEEKRMADLMEKTKRVKVSAGSAEELIDKIRRIDWDQVKPEWRDPVGSMIDYGA